MNNLTIAKDHKLNQNSQIGQQQKDTQSNIKVQQINNKPKFIIAPLSYNSVEPSNQMKKQQIKTKQINNNNKNFYPNYVLKQEQQLQKTSKNNKNLVSQHCKTINKYFNNTLPNNMEINSYTIFGECKVQFQSFTPTLYNINSKRRGHKKDISVQFNNNNSRKLYKYILNNEQLLLKKIQSQNIFTQILQKSSFSQQRIKMSKIVCVMVSHFYADILIIYLYNQNEKRRQKQQKQKQLLGFIDPIQSANDVRERLKNNQKQFSLLIQEVDMVNNNFNKKFISYIQKYNAKLSQNNLHKISIQYKNCTTLGHQQFLHSVYGYSQFEKRENYFQPKRKIQEQNNQNQENKEGIIEAHEIQKIKIVNLKQIRKQIQDKNQIKTDRFMSEQSGQRINKKEVNIKKLYDFIKQVKHQREIKKSESQNQNIFKRYYRQYIVMNNKPGSINLMQKKHRQLKSNKQQDSIKPKQVIDLSDTFSTVKVILKQTLVQHPQIIRLLYNQCECYRSKELSTPYIPRLLKSAELEQYIVMEYIYYQGKTLRQLINENKLSKNNLKMLKSIVAEIVVALGHIHECGYIYGPVTLENVIINYDGHVMLLRVDLIDKKHRLNTHIQQRVDQNNKEQSKNSQQQIIPKIKNLHKYRCDVRDLVPQQLICYNNQHKLNQHQNQNQSIMQTDFVSDWFSLGMLLFEIINQNHYNQILNLSVQIVKKYYSNLTPLKIQRVNNFIKQQPHLEDFLKCLLQKNPKSRLGFKNDYHALLDHPYLKGVDHKKLMKREGEPIVNMKRRRVRREKQNVEIEGNDMNDDFKKSVLQKQLKKWQNKDEFARMLKQIQFDAEQQIN